MGGSIDKISPPKGSVTAPRSENGQLHKCRSPRPESTHGRSPGFKVADRPASQHQSIFNIYIKKLKITHSI